jgi:hypothetical protein
MVQQPRRPLVIRCTGGAWIGGSGGRSRCRERWRMHHGRFVLPITGSRNVEPGRPVHWNLVDVTIGGPRHRGVIAVHGDVVATAEGRT